MPLRLNVSEAWYWRAMVPVWVVFGWFGKVFCQGLNLCYARRCESDRRDWYLGFGGKKADPRYGTPIAERYLTTGRR